MSLQILCRPTTVMNRGLRDLDQFTRGRALDDDLVAGGDLAGLADLTVDTAVQVPARGVERPRGVDIDGGGPGVDRRRRAAFDRRADRQPHPAEADDRTHEREFREGLEPVEENVAAEAQRVETVRGGAESGPALVGVGDRA